MEQSNYFCNSLVDRIVPGTPNSDMKARIEETLGYKDNLLTVSEVYRLWAIEGNEKVKEVLSFATADEGVIIEPSIEIYRELKLRLLNGAHTLTCGLAYLSGINTVRDGMENEELASFMRNLMLGEIAPSIPYKVDEKAARRFALRTYERFQNKHIEHQWINITAQYSSKMKMRNLPLLLNYYKIFESVPAYFALGFSAYLLFMKGVKKENGKIYGKRGDEFYVINDSMAEYFYEKWQSTDPTKIVNEVLKDKAFWGSDLTLLSGLSEKVNVWLKRMLEVGVAEALHQFSSRG
jgi:tagaturonate reductase